MQTFPRLCDLTVHGEDQKGFLADLVRVEPGGLVGLKRLQLGSRDPACGELETVAHTLESCVQRGLQLDAFSYLFLNYGVRSRATFEERFELQGDTLHQYRERLRIVAGSVKLSANDTELPTAPKL
ncbi:hypothetical protein L227DRAFT_309330 [Lentinus tigrinus ALCF2SS1-6]|uniref:Uncharacterized protein n=1 Tax=Lentinus tigrinus ALCF2SS1-6 TaxID=1328759 RepID=A0A5C2RVI9_9APHY|nr:hypothetical protein L227DRAFT_309330 [Lentinus tigrinus ALCF2SS1-6]